jgi:hypothetical protein
VKRVALLVASVLLLAACGGGGGGNPEAAKVKQVWTSFFTAKSSVAAHVALLQNGAKFKSVIEGFLSNPLAKSAKTTVSSVTLRGTDTAKVVYSIGVAGASLGNQTGYAYKVNGRRVVGSASLCKLISLEGSTPAACKS